MAGRGTIVRSIHHVQPIWSTSNAETRSRVIKLYKTWYRQIPHIVDDYNLPYSSHQCRAKLHDEFMKQKHLADIRQIDMQVIRKQLELKEICCMQKNRSHLLNYWSNDAASHTTQPTKFLAKFLVGQY
ncbi:NADH dehydrogenase [ubiquinone] 1 alpha subcomplex subunit 6-like [Sitodiplosis mosellana]|uniref:NADH dehydrogenase [ubiquinone] 1 alpha subcomplex subunit 6-like n=1 Tax=Sitodiplosis mosellana TaxID=263140 RepID=UPI002443A365|nr:NADH dehydrogenase [ubiquinone] 1 alpha subcomplex subunit 6-like [Sitodiplosis mosellana]